MNTSSHSVLPHTILAPEIQISHHSSQNQRIHFISQSLTRTKDSPNCPQTNLPSPHHLLLFGRFLWKPELQVPPAFAHPGITQLWGDHSSSLMTVLNNILLSIFVKNNREALKITLHSDFPMFLFFCFLRIIAHKLISNYNTVLNAKFCFSICHKRKSKNSTHSFESIKTL